MEYNEKVSKEKVKQTSTHMGGVGALITPDQVVDMLMPTSMGKRLVTQMDTFVRCVGAIIFYQKGVQRLPSAAELIMKEAHRLRGECILVQEAMLTTFTILTGEWADAMAAGTRDTGPRKSPRPW